MSSNTKLLRKLISELRYLSYSGKASQAPITEKIIELHRKFQVTDLQLCKARDEMKYIANTYAMYLQGQRKYKELIHTYNAGQERSVKETADLVGFKLPQDPK